MYNSTRLKVQMYISSLWLLFFMLIIMNINIPLDFGEGSKFIGTPLIWMNIIPLICLFFLGLSRRFVKTFEYQISSSSDEYFVLKKLKNKNYEHLTFLTTYIIPLICFDLSQIRYTIILILLMIVIGVIYVKTDIYYANPTLALLGYHLYEASVELRDEQIHENCILIVKGKITINSQLEYLQVDEDIFFVKEKMNVGNEYERETIRSGEAN